MVTIHLDPLIVGFSLFALPPAEDFNSQGLPAGPYASRPRPDHIGLPPLSTSYKNPFTTADSRIQSHLQSLYVLVDKTVVGRKQCCAGWVVQELAKTKRALAQTKSDREHCQGLVHEQ